MRARFGRALILGTLLVLAGFGGTVPVAWGQGLAQAGPEGQDQVIVTVPVLNVRAGPGTGYAIVDRASAGSSLTVLGQNGGGSWLQVRTPGFVTGWVSAQLVARTVETSDTFDAYDPYDGRPTRVVAPSIGLDSRVVPNGWHDVRNADGSVSTEWDVPAYAAGWLINSARPGESGNVVLAGHHNILGQVFRYVVNLKPGDRITLYVGSEAYNYRVTDRFILPDKYVPYEQRVENARWIGPFPDERLTLITCWPYTNNTHRVIVIAKPTGE